MDRRVQRQASRIAGVEARTSRRSTPVAAQIDERVLALQRSAGNAAVTDVVTRRGARGIQRAPLPDKDNEAIVARLHEAMAGWGTDEEAIFVSLQKLNKDAAAIAKDKELYKKTYSSELEDDIRDEMSGTELALAC